jgi:ssDNA-binding replication factor A large subunit
VDDDQAIKGISYSITKIKAIDELAVQSVVDVLGVVRELGKVTQQKLNSGDTKPKLSFALCDDTSKIQITLWGSQAENFKGVPDQIIFMKGLRVSEYNGTKQLNASGTTSTICDHNALKQDIPE